MAGATEWTINLGGNFASALEKSNAALGDTEKGAKHAAKEFSLFEGEVGHLSTSLGGLELNFSSLAKGGSLFTFDLAEGAAVAFEAIKKVAEAVFDLGKEMVGAAADAQDLNLAVKLDVGEEGAEKVDKLAESFSNSAFSPKQIKEALLPILEESGNEHQDQWADLTTAATDFATRQHTGIGGAKAALASLQDIELNPQRLRGSLKQLNIKQKDYYAELGDLMGISAKSAEAQTKAGQMKSKDLLNAALWKIAQREGGALGNATNEGAKTMGATLARLGNLKENLFEGIADSPGMHAVQGFLDNFIETMQGPIGTELVGKLSDAFTSLFGDLSGADGLEKMKEGIGGLAHEAEHFIDAFTETWPQIQADFEAALPVAEKLLGVLGKTLEVVLAIPRLGGEFGDDAADEANAKANGTVGKLKVGAASYALDDKDRNDALDRAGNGGLLHRMFTFDNNLAAEAFEQLDKENAFGNRPKSMGAAHSLIEEYNPVQLAAGGVVSRATLAVIGEAGPEAVVPLDRLGDSSDISSSLGQAGETTITFAPVYHFSGNDSHENRRQAEHFNEETRVAMQQLLAEIRSTLGG